MKFEYPHSDKVAGKFGRDTVKLARRNLNLSGFGGQKGNRKKNSTGSLSKSLYFRIVKNSSGYTVEFLSTENYAGIVEEGRRAGTMPPPNEINKWIENKKLRLRENKITSSGQKVSQFVKKDAKSMQRASYAIALSIKKRGIPAVPYFGAAMNEAFEELQDPLQKALVKDMEDIIFDSFQKSKFKK